MGMETDVYVFAREADPELVGELEEGTHEEVRFVASTTGAFAAFAVVEIADLETLPQTLRSIFGNPGATGLETAVPILWGPSQLRWTKQYPYIAFSRIRSRPGRAMDVLAGTAVVPGYNGSAIVAGGGYDVLVEFGAHEEDELRDRLLHGLHAVKGVAWSDTAIVARYYYRGPKSKAASA